jgi:hypothetical protein
MMKLKLWGVTSWILRNGEVENGIQLGSRKPKEGKRKWSQREGTNKRKYSQYFRMKITEKFEKNLIKKDKRNENFDVSTCYECWENYFLKIKGQLYWVCKLEKADFKISVLRAERKASNATENCYERKTAKSLSENPKLNSLTSGLQKCIVYL